MPQSSRSNIHFSYGSNGNKNVEDKENEILSSISENFLLDIPKRLFHLHALHHSQRNNKREKNIYIYSFLIFNLGALEGLANEGLTPLSFSLLRTLACFKGRSSSARGPKLLSLIPHPKWY